MKISIYGSGYVGLVTAACLADAGHQVLCMDIDTYKIEQLSRGVIPIYEPGLELLVQRYLKTGQLSFTDCSRTCAEFATVQFIAVGTPPDEDGSADLQHVLAVAADIARYMNGYRVIINKSTVPVGTAERVSQRVSEILRHRVQPLEFDVCSNPEFLKEGSALKDFRQGPRIVLGCDSKRASTHLQACYEPFITPKIFMSVRAAELTKYAANAMLATRISFINEIAALADAADVDIEDVRRGIGSDPRIGPDFIKPGCGYGGSCFPKDVQALIRTCDQYQSSSELLAAVERVNQQQKHLLFEKLIKRLGTQDLRGLTFAVWGLAFKPGTDDMREAPSRYLMERIWQAGGSVQACDPQVLSECVRLYPEHPQLALSHDPASCLEGADVLLICTEWPIFRSFPLPKISQQLSSGIVIDGRNIFEPSAASAAGIEYYGIGRR